MLEEVFESMGKKAQAKKCDAMQGLLEEAESIMKETTPGAVRDAGINGAAQKVEHYEIATYGTLATYAKALDMKPASKAEGARYTPRFSMPWKKRLNRATSAAVACA